MPRELLGPGHLLCEPLAEGLNILGNVNETERSGLAAHLKSHLPTEGFFLSRHPRIAPYLVLEFDTGSADEHQM